MDLNKVFILGRLTSDPQLKLISSGKQMAIFSVATNRIYKDKDGKTQKDVTYHNVIAWGRNAEIANSFLRKGSLVLIEGRLQNRTYTGSDGQNKKRTEIICERMQLGPKSTNTFQESEMPKNLDEDSKNSQNSQNDLPEIELEEDTQEIKEDDLPF